MEFESAITKNLWIFFQVWFHKKDWTFPFKNETQHHSNDCHGWPYSTPFDRLFEDEHFYRKIIFSDEAHFHIGGYVNKQNCRIWHSKDLNVIIDHHHLGAVIWTHWTIFCGEPLRLSVMLTIQWRLRLRNTKLKLPFMGLKPKQLKI